MNLTFSIFPKFYQHLTVPELAALVREVGLDTSNAVVRDGFWVSESSLAADLPHFVGAMQNEGLSVRFATTGYSASQLIADPSPHCRGTAAALDRRRTGPRQPDPRGLRGVGPFLPPARRVSGSAGHQGQHAHA